MDSVQPPATSRNDLSGSTLGDFRLEKRLGQGGMGQVYLAEQISLQRKTAVKVMRPEMTANPTALKRFVSEAQAIARITHPNIVQVYTSGSQDGVHYIALEFVEGISLGQYLTRKGPLPIPLALKVLKQVAAALAHAGEQGIVHRDIKPENILITKKADAKVTDFGLARSLDEGEAAQNLTQSGVVVGTPTYMSPEQVQGKKTDCRTDIYSLGITAYHMLAGRPPFKGDSAFALALHHVQSTPPSLREARSDVSAALEAIVLRMMAKNPDERFANGRDLLKALNQLPTTTDATGERKLDMDLTATPYRVLDGESNGNTEAAPRRRSTLHGGEKKRSSAPLWIAVGVGLLLMVPVLLGGAFVGYRFMKGKTEQADQARASEPPTPEPPRPAPVPPPPTDPALPQWKPDPAEEQKLKNALTTNFTPTKPRRFREEIHAYVALAGYYLRTRETEKAEEYFTRMRAPANGKPVFLNLIGEVGQGIQLAQRGDHAGSNDILVKILRRPAPVGAGPRAIFQLPELKPFVIDALERNARGGPLPEELVELRRVLHGR